MKRKLLSSTPRKMQLQRELIMIEKNEEKELREKHYPLIKEKYEGTFFKCPNSYNGNNRWNIYTKVTEIKPKDIYDTNGNGVTSHYTGYSFQTDCYNKIQIDRKATGYVHSLGKEISEAEFNEAWNKMIEQMNALK